MVYCNMQNAHALALADARKRRLLERHLTVHARGSTS
jgi:hypothetical protein